MGEGSFSCCLNVSPKVLEVIPLCSSLQVRSQHWNHYMAPPLLTMGSFSLGETRRVLKVLLSLEVDLYAIPSTDLCNAFAESIGVWYDYETLGFDFIGGGLGGCSALAVSPIIDLTVRPGKSFLHLVQST